MVPTEPIRRMRCWPFGTAPTRTAWHGENFLRPSGEPDAIMPIDYFVWAIRGPLDDPAPGVIVIDTGMSRDAVSRRPGRIILTTVERALANAGIEAAQVEDVVVTHMHYDHAGGLDLFPNAALHLQDREMAFCTGRSMRHDVLGRRSTSTTSWGRCGTCTADGWRSTMARPRSHPGSPCTSSAVTPMACRWYGCPPRGAGWCWPRMRRICGPTFAPVTPFRSSPTSPGCWRGTGRLSPSPTVPTTSSPGHDPLVLARFPTLAGQPDIVRLDQQPSG